MICSCLIPSRKRINRLFTAIHTINESAHSADNFEILIRLDEDDEDSLKFIRTLQGFRNVRVLVGPRYDGWQSVESKFYTQLGNEAKGEWCWFLLDDMIIGGKDWDLKLMQVPLVGHIVQPEISRLGGSTYPKWEGANFPCVPTRSWLQLGWTKIERPVDTGLDKLLRLENGWKTWFLPGITAWHLEDTDERLVEHRKL